MIKQLLFFLFSVSLSAQVTFSGKVLDAKTKEALPGASLYIPNTSIGTTSDFDGSFNFVLPKNAKELVISFLGYYTVNVNIDISDEKDFSKTILLREKSKQLNEVVLVKQKQDDIWKHRFYVFKQHFLGNSTLAENAEILNKEALYFEELKDSTGYLLKANCNEPLLIKNKKTGYLITYDLKDFHFFRSRDNESQVFYVGYAFFEDIVNKEKLNAKKIKKNRNLTYKGSIAHFIKSVYNNSFIDEGFKVNHFIIKDNPDYHLKEKGEEMLKKIQKDTKRIDILCPENFSPKKISILGREYSKSDFVKETEGKQYFSFDDYIYITYKNEKPDANYYERTKYQISYITLQEPVEFYSNGFYFNPIHLIQYEYMGWKKIGDALPLDYEP